MPEIKNFTKTVNNMKNADNDITIIEIQDSKDLQKHKEEIDSFLDDPLVHSNLYHYPDYIESVVKTDTSIKIWNIILIKDSGELVSVIPIYISNKKYPIKFALFTLLNFKINLLKFFGDSLSYRLSYNITTIHGFLKQYLKSSLTFDLGILNALPADDLLFSDFTGVNKGDLILKPLSKHFEVVRYLNFPETWGDYLASMKRKRRYNLKRNIKIINDSSNDDINLKCFDTENDVESFLIAMDDIYKNTWQSSTFGHKSRFNDSEINQNKTLAKLGFFKSFILFSSDTAIAFIRGYLYKGKYYYEEIGYKQDWAKYNPGSVLNFLMLQYLMEGNLQAKELNFGYGENIYKKVFSNGEYKATNGFLYKKGSKGEFIFLIQQKLGILYTVISKFIIKLNLDVTIRRILRKKMW